LEGAAGGREIKRTKRKGYYLPDGYNRERMDSPIKKEGEKPASQRRKNQKEALKEIRRGGEVKENVRISCNSFSMLGGGKIKRKKTSPKNLSRTKNMRKERKGGRESMS